MSSSLIVSYQCLRCYRCHCLINVVISYGCHQNMVNVIVCYCCHYLLFMLSPIIMSLVSYRCHHFAVVVAYRCCLLSMWLSLINVIDSNLLSMSSSLIADVVSYCWGHLFLMSSIVYVIVSYWCQSSVIAFVVYYRCHYFLSGLWIRIHFMRIWIQQFFWIRIRIRVQVQLNQILRKIIMKSFFKL